MPFFQHDETMRRHTQQIEQKREKAIELSMLRHYRTTDVAPQHKPYEKKKMCALCNVMVSQFGDGTYAGLEVSEALQQLYRRNKIPLSTF